MSDKTPRIEICNDTTSNEEESKGNVKVLCRFRPLNQKEIDAGIIRDLEFAKNAKTVSMKVNEGGSTNSAHTFTYDYVFKPDDS